MWLVVVGASMRVTHLGAPAGVLLAPKPDTAETPQRDADSG